jgi:AbiV family abortive infection protein
MAKLSNKHRSPIAPASLAQGYNLSVDNGLRLFASAMELNKTFPDKALALAQVGQEEIGKSLTLLAAFALPEDLAAWGWFWDGWHSHNLKAHRAFLYEWLNPTRIELKYPDGARFAGEPLRASMPREKESGLYVDYDENSASFVAPASSVTHFEALARTSTLLYLGATAEATRRALMNADSMFRLSAFGEIAFRICSEGLYQQDMPEILSQFENRSARHRLLVQDLRTAFSMIRTVLHDAADAQRGAA